MLRTIHPPIHPQALNAAAEKRFIQTTESELSNTSTDPADLTAAKHHLTRPAAVYNTSIKAAAAD